MTRNRLIFGAVGLAILMSAIDFSILPVALPAMRSGLHTSLLLIGWTVTIYEFGQLLMLPLAGKLSDDFGRKRVVLLAVLIFTCSSFLCGFAPNVYVLVICRFVQALGGGAIVPVCTGIVAELFPDKRAQAVGLFSSIFPIGGVIGPNLGGVLVDHLSWRYIFYVNVPIGVAVLFLLWYLYHPGPPALTRHRADFLGTALYGGAILALLIMLTWLGEASSAALRSPGLWLLILGSIGMLALFVRNEGRTAEPMLELDLVRGRAFMAANGYAFIWGSGIYGFAAFLPTYAELHYGMSATAAGALLTPRGIVMIVVSIVASFYLIRSGYRWPMIVGVIIVSASLVLTSIGPVHPQLFGRSYNAFVYMAAVTALLGVGFGLSGPASNNAALDLAPQKVASITGIRSMFRETGGTLGAGTTVFVVSLFADPARGLQVVFVFLALILLLVVPLVFFIPDMARNARGALLQAAAAAARERQPAVSAVDGD